MSDRSTPLLQMGRGQERERLLVPMPREEESPHERDRGRSPAPFPGQAERLLVQEVEEQEAAAAASANLVSTSLHRRKDMLDDRGALGQLKAGAQRSMDKFALLFWLYAVYLIVEIVVGVMSGSLTLISDALHMLTDLVAIAIGWYAAKVSIRPGASDMSFGYRRAEIVGALANGCFLLAVVCIISLQAVERLVGLEGRREETLAANALIMVGVGGAGLAITLGGMCMFGGHGHSHGGKSC
eukprot:CAMPEP_0114178134 /NCGR_PEP_ID=MMETSP0043_2-20121206/38385_1 /TAXON_ID=464988 /ORGANISM="Hemiselmis andersenii, Strain CCMP644" /LENGTH=240 /DNA_ID=CAMNT_0001276533 /DNA_START=23 /DNA_END=742 /DNA_ORIENTATION=+